MGNKLGGISLEESSADDIAKAVSSFGEAYVGYEVLIRQNGISGEFILSLNSEEEVKECMADLGITKLHQKVLYAPLSKLMGLSPSSKTVSPASSSVSGTPTSSIFQFSNRDIVSSLENEDNSSKSEQTPTTKWLRCFDIDHKAHYYFNNFTHETQWEEPTNDGEIVDDEGSIALAAVAAAEAEEEAANEAADLAFALAAVEAATAAENRTKKSADSKGKSNSAPVLVPVPPVFFDYNSFDNIPDDDEDEDENGRNSIPSAPPVHPFAHSDVTGNRDQKPIPVMGIPVFSSPASSREYMSTTSAVECLPALSVQSVSHTPPPPPNSHDYAQSRREEEEWERDWDEDNGFDEDLDSSDDESLCGLTHEQIVSVLCEMGFPRSRAEKCTHRSGNHINVAIALLLAKKDFPNSSTPLMDSMISDGIISEEERENAQLQWHRTSPLFMKNARALGTLDEANERLASDFSRTLESGSQLSRRLFSKLTSRARNGSRGHQDHQVSPASPSGSLLQPAQSMSHGAACIEDNSSEARNTQSVAPEGQHRYEQTQAVSSLAKWIVKIRYRGKQVLRRPGYTYGKSKVASLSPPTAIAHDSTHVRVASATYAIVAQTNPLQSPEQHSRIPVAAVSVNPMSNESPPNKGMLFGSKFDKSS